MKFKDPTGLKRSQVTDEDEEDETRNERERDRYRELKEELERLNEKKDLIEHDGNSKPSKYDRVRAKITEKENEILEDLTRVGYEAISDLVDSILNDRLADIAENMVGGNYIYGGKTYNNLGSIGMDFSGVIQAAIEAVSEIGLRPRNADGQVTDPNLTIPGDGSRGTLNYYDWKGDGKYDHVAVELGGGRVVHPQGDEKNVVPKNPGEMIIRGPFNTDPNNRQVNLGYIFFK